VVPTGSKSQRPYIASMQLPFAIRDFGQALFRSIPVRVRSGINHNMKWSIVTPGRGYGSGSFGRDRIDALRAVVRPGDAFWDIGAHKGFMTLAAAQMVGATGRVVSIEPSNRNRWFLERHLSWNQVANVTVVPSALSGEEGEARFGGRGDSLAYELGTGDETVPVRTVEAVMRDFQVPAPAILKIDAEAQEGAILQGSGDAITSDAALLISVHGRPQHEVVTAWLRQRDFRILESWEMARCSADTEHPWTSDYDLLAVGPDREAGLERIGALPLFTRE
jgi:FkbM family methyltransferase